MHTKWQTTLRKDGYDLEMRAEKARQCSGLINKLITIMTSYSTPSMHITICTDDRN